MKRDTIGRLFTGLLLAGVLSHAGEPRTSVAVLTLNPKQGISTEEASILSDRLESEVVKRGQYAVVARATGKDETRDWRAGRISFPAV